MENLYRQPFQCVGRSGGSSPYCRKRASRHSCALSSVPLPVEGCTVSQVLIFVARCGWRACKTGAPYSTAVRDSSARLLPLFLTTVRPSQRQPKWSAVKNSTWPLSIKGFYLFFKAFVCPGSTIYKTLFYPYFYLVLFHFLSELFLVTIIDSVLVLSAASVNKLFTNLLNSFLIFK